MGRKKAPFKNYEGKKSNDKHIRLTADMMTNQKFLDLSNSSKVLYMYMKLWALGNEEFEYAETLSNKYMSKATFYKARDELIDSGFIKIIATNKFAHIPNKYKFSFNWRD